MRWWVSSWKRAAMSMPTYRRPNWRAASPVVPAPENGSNTTPPGEQEQQLVRRRQPIAHRLRHRVRLGPDDRVAQPPSGGLEGEGDPPWHPDEVLRGQRRSAAHRWRPPGGDASAGVEGAFRPTGV